MKIRNLHVSSSERK